MSPFDVGEIPKSGCTPWELPSPAGVEATRLPLRALTLTGWNRRTQRFSQARAWAVDFGRSVRDANHGLKMDEMDEEWVTQAIQFEELEGCTVNYKHHVGCVAFKNTRNRLHSPTKGSEIECCLVVKRGNGKPLFLMEVLMQISSGWWFGCHFLFSH